MSKRLCIFALCGVLFSPFVFAETLTVVSWGGAYTKSQDEAYHKPYTKKYGTTIQNVDKGSAAPAGIKAQVESGNVVWDVVDVLEGDAIRMCDEGLVEEISYDKLLAKGNDGSKPSADFVKGSLSGCFIPTIVYSTVFAYNKNLFPSNPPKTIADVFNVKDYPGKRALEKTSNNNLEWALIADGVAISDVYKVFGTAAGVNRAFKKLDTIKSNVVWWEAGAQPPQLLADKEVSIASGYNGRFYDAVVNENQPFEIIWDGQAFELDGFVVPKGKLTSEVKRYIYFSTDSQRLADQAKYISYGPARNSSFPLLIDKVKPHLPTSNFDNPLKVDGLFRAENSTSFSERFNAWLAK